MLDLIARLESEVRGYVRSFPTTFSTASGAWMTDVAGRRYLDFFAGAGALNYGHNHPLVKEALVRYIQADGIGHSLDMATQAKVAFLQSLQRRVLIPRGLSHKVQFTGPTGTNAVEAALKLARKYTQRPHVVAFTGGYHGHSLGSLSVTANRYYHDNHYGSRNNVTHLPYDGYLGDIDTSTLLEKMLADPSSGVPLPAAVILEPIQGEGGINVASSQWLQNVQQICRRHGVLLICDEIQMGNGRTGGYFAFEASGIEPDMICLSKSLGGGLPLSLLLLRPELDVWKPGQHTGTFRGNNLAFVAGQTLLEHFWADNALARQVTRHGEKIQAALAQIAQRYPQGIRAVRGRGMVWGIEMASGELARKISATAFDLGLIVETAGADDQVVKLLPPLVISGEDLDQGLMLLQQAIGTVLGAAILTLTPAASETVATAIPAITLADLPSPLPLGTS